GRQGTVPGPCTVANGGEPAGDALRPADVILVLWYDPTEHVSRAAAPWNPRTPEAARLMIDTNVLRAVPLFADFDDEQIDHIARTVSVRTYRRGQFVVRQDDPGGTFYVLLD